MPKIRILLPALLLTLSLPALAQQVYRSTDAQGNVVFSDTPSSGSETVTIDTPNISDPVAVPPPSATPEPAAKPTPAPTAAPSPLPEGDLTGYTGGTNKRKKRYRRNMDYEYGR